MMAEGIVLPEATKEGFLKVWRYIFFEGDILEVIPEE